MTRSGKLVWRVLLVAIAATAILYGAAQAAIRSPWFRVAVERRLSKATGMEVRVGRIRPTESLNLRLSDISVLEDRAGMEVKVIRVKWNFFARRGYSRIRKLSAEDAVLTLAPDDNGNLLPSFAGERTWELVSNLMQGRLQNQLPASAAGDGAAAERGDEAGSPHEGAPQRASSPAEGTKGGIAAGAEEDGGRMYGDFGGIRRVRLIRGTFSLRDANGNERAFAKDVEINRKIDFDAAGLKVEHWEVQAAMLAAEGMELPNLDWAADYTEEGGWNVTRFESDGWSGWEPAALPEEVERATETYRELLDSI